jgi:hypothetical protein
MHTRNSQTFKLLSLSFSLVYLVVTKASLSCLGLVGQKEKEDKKEERKSRGEEKEEEEKKKEKKKRGVHGRRKRKELVTAI